MIRKDVIKRTAPIFPELRSQAEAATNRRSWARFLFEKGLTPCEILVLCYLDTTLTYDDTFALNDIPECEDDLDGLRPAPGSIFEFLDSLDDDDNEEETGGMNGKS